MYFVTLGSRVFATHYPYGTNGQTRTCLLGFKDKRQALHLKNHIEKSNNAIFHQDNLTHLAVEYVDYTTTTFETMMHLNTFCYINVDSFDIDSQSNELHVQGALTCHNGVATLEHAIYFEQLYKKNL